MSDGVVVIVFLRLFVMENVRFFLLNLSDVLVGGSRTVSQKLFGKKCIFFNIKIFLKLIFFHHYAMSDY